MTYPITYDAWLKSYWEQWLPPAVSWLWGKAQIAAESNFDPKARSPAGALGLAQFLPDTFDDAREVLNFPSFASPLDPQYALQAFAWYMSKLYGEWIAPRPVLDRLHLAQSAYNAGMKSMVRAQLAAQKALGHAVSDYLTIATYLPQITGVDNARQTTSYVTRIGAIYLDLTGANIGSGS